MTKLTLNQAWTQTLRMWDYVVRKWSEGQGDDVSSLKRKWLEKNALFEKLANDCHFCEYAQQQDPECGICNNCPARLVDSFFHCQQTDYDWRYHPDAFRRKIRALDRKRRTKT